MGSLLLELDTGGQVLRYTTAAAVQTVGGQQYQPGLRVDAVQVHALGQTGCTVTDPHRDWPALVLELPTPPRWLGSLYWSDDTGRIQLQTGVAIVGALGSPSSVLPLSVDSATVPGARQVPDPATATITAGDWPAGGHGAASYEQDTSSIGATLPRVYGAPGLSAMEAGASVGGPTGTAYRLEAGTLPAVYVDGWIAVASPPTAASSVTLYDVSAGQYEDGTYATAQPTLQIVEDAQGRQVQVCTLAGLPYTGKPMGAEAGTRYGVSWSTSDPATSRSAAYVVADLLEASGRPVDAARMQLDGLLYDVSIESPTDPLAWVLEQTAGLPLFIGRSSLGHYARLVPIDRATADLQLTLGLADSHSGIVPAEPAGIVSQVQVSYAPIDGELSRRVWLTATGSEAGATAHPSCQVAASAGYDGLLAAELPAVCDPATASRVAALLAIEYATPGPAVSLTITDPASLRRLLLLGPACLVQVASDGTDDGPDLTGYRIAVDAMTVTDSSLTLAGTVRR